MAWLMAMAVLEFGKSHCHPSERTGLTGYWVRLHNLSPPRGAWRWKGLRWVPVWDACRESWQRQSWLGRVSRPRAGTLHDPCACDPPGLASVTYCIYGRVSRPRAGTLHDPCACGPPGLSSTYFIVGQWTWTVCFDSSFKSVISINQWTM